MKDVLHRSKHKEKKFSKRRAYNRTALSIEESVWCGGRTTRYKVYPTKKNK